MLLLDGKVSMAIDSDWKKLFNEAYEVDEVL